MEVVTQVMNYTENGSDLKFRCDQDAIVRVIYILASNGITNEQ